MSGAWLWRGEAPVEFEKRIFTRPEPGGSWILTNWTFDVSVCSLSILYLYII